MKTPHANDPDTMLVVDGPLQSYEISEIFVAIATDGRRDGIVSVTSPDGATMPILSSNPALLDATATTLEKLAKESGKTIEIRRYSMAETLRTFTP